MKLRFLLIEHETCCIFHKLHSSMMATQWKTKCFQQIYYFSNIPFEPISCLIHMPDNNWTKMSLFFVLLFDFFIIWARILFTLMWRFLLLLSLFCLSMFFSLYLVLYFSFTFRHRKPERIHIILWTVRLWSSPDSC